MRVDICESKERGRDGERRGEREGERKGKGEAERGR